MLQSSQSENKVSIWLSQTEFYTDQAITGNLCINGKMRATELRLSFFGYDNLTEWQRHQSAQRQRYLRRSFQENRFVEATMLIAKFGSNFTEDSKCAYPFKINLPENLPQTIHFNSQKIQGLQGNLCYFLVAELYDGEEVTEAYDCEVLINRQGEGSAQEYEDSRMVGGYFGYRQTSSTNKLTLCGNVFRPGQTVRATIDSNNEKCQHKIAEFKYKLFRRVTY